MSIKNIFTGAKSKAPQVIEEYKKPKQQLNFEESRKTWSERDIQMEMLYAQQILINKMDKVRGNTNTLIWWLVVLPIIAGIILLTILDA